MFGLTSKLSSPSDRGGASNDGGGLAGSLDRLKRCEAAACQAGAVEEATEPALKVGHWSGRWEGQAFPGSKVGEAVRQALQRHDTPRGHRAGCLGVVASLG